MPVYRLNKVQSVFLWQPLCGLRVVRTTAYLKAIMELTGKTFTGLGPIQVGPRFDRKNVWLDLSI